MGSPDAKRTGCLPGSATFAAPALAGPTRLHSGRRSDPVEHITGMVGWVITMSSYQESQAEGSTVRIHSHEMLPREPWLSMIR